MDSSVTISFKYHVMDFVRGWQARFGSRSRLKQNLTFAFLIVVWALYMSYAPRSRFEWYLFGFSAAALLLLIAGNVAFRSLVPRIIFGLSPRFRDDYTLTFSPDGVRVQSPRADSRLDWGRYNRAILGSQEYILCYGRNLFGIIPKRAFQTPEDQRVFEDLITRFVPEITTDDTDHIERHAQK